MTTLELFTLLIAGYGAVLSTANLIIRIREKITNVEFTVAHGIPVYMGPTGGSAGKDGLIFRVVNHGEQDAHIQAPRLRLPSGRTLVFKPGTLKSEVQFPHTLVPNKRCTSWVSKQFLAEGMAEHGLTGEVEVRCVVPDQAGNDHESDPVTFDVDEHL